MNNQQSRIKNLLTSFEPERRGLQASEPNGLTLSSLRRGDKRASHSIFHQPSPKLRPAGIPYSVKRSFTLIEILIASALFTGIVVLTVGSFTDTISFNAGANDERAVRQSARTFVDFMTLQLRRSSASPIYMASTDYTDPNPGSVASNYSGTGFLLLDTGNKYTLPTYATGGKATALIIPTPADAAGNVWIYIGCPDAVSGNACANNQPGMWKAKAQANAAQIPARDKWVSSGDLLPNNVSLLSLQFRGINARGPVYDAGGNVTKYSLPNQPYITIQMQTAPKNNVTNVASFETSISSRDFTYAFPQCTNQTNNPTQGCQ